MDCAIAVARPLAERVWDTLIRKEMEGMARESIATAIFKIAMWHELARVSRQRTRPGEVGNKGNTDTD